MLQGCSYFNFICCLSWDNYRKLITPVQQIISSLNKGNNNFKNDTSYNENAIFQTHANKGVIFTDYDVNETLKRVRLVNSYKARMALCDSKKLLVFKTTVHKDNKMLLGVII